MQCSNIKPARSRECSLASAHSWTLPAIKPACASDSANPSANANAIHISQHKQSSSSWLCAHAEGKRINTSHSFVFHCANDLTVINIVSVCHKVYTASSMICGCLRFPPWFSALVKSAIHWNWLTNWYCRPVSGGYVWNIIWLKWQIGWLQVPIQRLPVQRPAPAAPVARAPKRRKQQAVAGGTTAMAALFCFLFFWSPFSPQIQMPSQKGGPSVVASSRSSLQNQGRVLQSTGNLPLTATLP